MTPRKRVAILISGRGSNMLALIRAAADPDYPAEIVGVLSDRTDAGGLALASGEGIFAQALDRGGFTSREAHEAALDATLRELDARIVCLAGYMRLLSRGFVERWNGRLINIHPSLLPAFKGLDTHLRALEAGVAEHGCTVHWVTAEVDDGPIIAQTAVPVLAGDTEATLAARVLEAEHRLYPEALRRLIEGEAIRESKDPLPVSLCEPMNDRSSVRSKLPVLEDRLTKEGGMSAIAKISVALSPEALETVNRAVATGGYASPSEVVQAALHDWGSREAARQADTERLRQAWREGVESGQPQPLDFEEVKRKGRDRLSRSIDGSSG